MAGRVTGTAQPLGRWVPYHGRSGEHRGGSQAGDAIELFAATIRAGELHPAGGYVPPVAPLLEKLGLTLEQAAAAANGRLG